MKSFKFLYFFILFFILHVSCKQPMQKNKRIKNLKNEVGILKDSLNKLSLYFHFKKIRAVIIPSDTTLLYGKNYKFYCLIDADYMYKQGYTTKLSISGKSQKNNKFYFEKENGITKMVISPNVIGVDTIKLSYKFDFKNKDSIAGINLPARLIFKVRHPPIVDFIIKNK